MTRGINIRDMLGRGAHEVKGYTFFHGHVLNKRSWSFSMLDEMWRDMVMISLGDVGVALVTIAK